MIELLVKVVGVLVLIAIGMLSITATVIFYKLIKEALGN